MQEQEENLSTGNIEEITLQLGKDIEDIRVIATRKVNAKLIKFGIKADIQVIFKPLGEEHG